MHRFNDGQIDVPGRNPTRRDGPAHDRMIVSGGPAHSQTRPGIQRRVHSCGMTARERTLKRQSRLRLRIRHHHHGHQRLKPPQLAGRPQRRAIRFLSLIYLIRFHCPIRHAQFFGRFVDYENGRGLDLFKLGHVSKRDSTRSRVLSRPAIGNGPRNENFLCTWRRGSLP